MDLVGPRPSDLPAGLAPQPAHDTPSLLRGRLAIRLERDGLWLIRPCCGGGLRLALRACFDPSGDLRLDSAVDHGDTAVLMLSCGIGRFTVTLSWLEGAVPVLHCRTRLRVARDLRAEAWPHDLRAIGPGTAPSTPEGKVHVAQSGPTAGLVFFSVTGPSAATVLYFQDLGALSEYCDRVHADPVGSVTADWPELGMRLPRGDAPLEEGAEVTVSSAYLAVSETLPVSDTDLSQAFLSAVAAVYPHVEKPPTSYFDWPTLAERTVDDLFSSAKCTRSVDGHRYLNAYVGSAEKPPESMVQLAVLVPLTEYEGWRGQPIRLREELRESIPSFMDERLKTVVRWLPSASFGPGCDSEEEDPDRMDSWYYLHTLINLARLAEFGDAGCRELLLSSSEHAIRVAHRFNYDWPVFYRPDTLEVVKAETAPGEGGEQDVPGLYAHLMLQCYELTKDGRYRDEAERSARALCGKGFKLAYQTNNTIMSAIALVKLWQSTNNRLYLDLSVTCIANVVARLWLWNGRYGHAQHYETFMGVSPLQDAEYVAAYEEHECLAAAVNYLKAADDQAPPAAVMLLSEYCKYVLHRGRYYFTEALPEAAVCRSPREGEIDPGLSIPLEDLRTGWHQSGQVGQEVYGAAAALINCTYAFVKLASLPFIVHAEYPVLRFDYKLTHGGGEFRLTVSGSRDRQFRLVILGRDGRGLPRLGVRVLGDGGRELLPEGQPAGGLVEVSAPGGSSFLVSWRDSGGDVLDLP
jgi:hypothetical protein